MVKVDKYIEKLLLTHDCVIIPGLGGFVARYEAAYRVEQNESFYPPYRTIGFNDRLKMNDGLLAQAYMQAYDTNFPEATRMVEREADKIKKILHSDGLYRFEDLGTLELKSDGHLIFTPESEGGIAAPELYGLDAFMIEPYKEVEKAESETKADKTEQPAVVVPIETASVGKSTEKSSHYVIRLNRTLTNCVAAAVVAVIFYFAIAIPVSNGGDSAYKAASSENSVLYGFPIGKLSQARQGTPSADKASRPTVVPEAKSHEGETIADNQESMAEIPSALPEAKPEPAEAKVTTPETKTTEAETPYYTIVLASAIKESNARIFIDKLKSEGFGEAKFYKKKSMKRVIYSHYGSQEEAQRALHKLRDNENFEQAWVLEIK